MKTDKINVRIPHPGYYETYIGNVFDAYFSYRNDDLETDKIEMLNDFFYTNFNWNDEVNDRLGKIWCDAIEHQFDITISYDKTESPKYYNYETDKLYGSITRKQAADIIKRIRSEGWHKFKEYVFERTQNRSGFISFYKPDCIDDKPSNWDNNVWYFALCFLFEYESNDWETTLYEYCHDQLFGNGEAEAILNETQGAWLDRYFAVSDYLYQRTQRSQFMEAGK